MNLCYTDFKNKSIYKMRDRSIFALIIILAPFVFSFAFGLDIYIPIVPTMQAVFHASQTEVQLTLSLFLLVTGLGQLFVGPLSDHYGRKPILLVSCVLFTLGAFGCVFAFSIAWLIMARIVCALGACGMLAIAYALVRDLYSGEQNARIYSFLNGAIGISPTFAPIIGGYLAKAWGWTAVFWFLFGLGLMTFFNTLSNVQETLPNHFKLKFDWGIFKRYLSIARQRVFFQSALFAGFGVSIFFSFFSISPFVIIQLLHVSIEHFGYYFAVFGLVIAFGSLLAGKAVSRLGSMNTIKYGLIFLWLGGGIMVAWNYFVGLSLTGFLLPTVIACTGAAFLSGSSAARAMEPFAHMAGTAAAIFGACQFFIGSLIGTVLMRFPVHSSINYGVCILLVACLGSLNFLFYPATLAKSS